MAILATGNTFADGDQVTSTKLNNIANAATFAADAVDDSTTELSSGKIIIKDGGVTPAKLSTNHPNWDSTGLGVGTSSPTSKLDVETSSSSADGIDINNTSTGDPVLEFQLAGTSKFVMGVDNSDSDKFKIGTTAVETSTCLTIDSTGPKLTIGSGAAADTAIIFDGNAQDYYIALDDSADDLLIGLGSTVGTSAAIAIDENLQSTFGGDIIISGTTPTLTIGDAEAEDTAIVFDGNAKDFYIALDDSADKLIIGEGSTVGTNSILTITDDSVTIGDASAVDTKIVFDGNAQDFYIGLDDSADDLIIGLGSTVGTTPSISVDENQLATFGAGITSIAAANTLGATSFNDADISNVGSIALDTITNDGTDITLDSSNDIVLDADGAQVRLKDAGTERFTFNLDATPELDVTGGDFTIHQTTSDADIIFNGNDGGSAITALTLDMSAAGAATFNDKIVATELDISGNIDVDGTTNLDVVDIDGAVDMASTLTVAGNVDFNGDLDVAGTINLAAIAIDGTFTVGEDNTGYDVTFFGATSGAYLLWDESADDLKLVGAAGLTVAGDVDIDGTTNLDAVDIDGNVQLDGTLIVGVNDTGYDVKLFGATSGAYLMWDESADKLLTAGGAVVDIVKDKLLIGGTAVTTTAAELNILDGVTSTAAELNLLDGSVANSVVNSKAVIYGSSGELAGTLSTAAQTSVTSLGTLTALTVDDVAINGKVITMTGSASDTAVLTAGTNGTLSIVTTDAAAAAANIQITADGTVDIDSAGVLTLDSGAAINIEPAAGSAILLDGTISVDAGVVTGATSITSTAFVGGLTGNVTGNTSGTAATVTTAAQPNITSLGTLTALTVDNLGVNGNTITANSGALNLTPASGSAIVLDGTINVDAGVVTGATSITSTAFVGDITGDVTGNVSGTAATVTTAAQSNITSLGTLTTIDVNGTSNLDAVDIDGAVDMASTLDVTGDITFANDLEINVDGSANGSKAIVINSSGDAFESNDGMIEGTHAGSGPFTGGYWLKFSSGGSDVFTVKGDGAVAKGSGSFKISHPLESKAETHNLVHSFIEGPQADLIYRGRVDLIGGDATVNIDIESGMTDGTFVVLCRDVQSFTTNESGWTAVRSSVSGNILTIEAQDPTSTDSISWMVVGERQDDHMMNTGWTDEIGKVIVEPLIEEEENE